MTNTLIKAPSISEIRIETLSANYAILRWDNVGRNFYYIVEIKNITDNGEWVMVSHVPDSFITIENIKPMTEYIVRISVGSKGFERSDYAFTDTFKTFEYNLYSFDMMNEVVLSDKFIEEKFTKNNRDYIDFNNDTLFASLMVSGFEYPPAISNVSYLQDKILKRDENHELLCNISKLCKNDKRVMMGFIDEKLYMVERFQSISKISNNKGQTWQIVDLFDGRAGDPISNTVFYQNASSTFALGYNHIFRGRPTNNIRWSSIKHRFSQTDISFTRFEDNYGLGYEIEVFDKYIKLPLWLDNGIAESFTVTNDSILVAGNGRIYYSDFSNPIFDKEPTSPTFNQRVFGEDSYIELLDESVVIKKMDSIDNNVLCLVTGRLKEGKRDKRNPKNIESFEGVGVYKVTRDGCERVFGNTEEERYYIEHLYTNMSINGKEFFINYGNYKYTRVDTDDEYKGIIESNIVRDRGYLNSNKLLMGSFRADKRDVYTWTKGFMKYYNESDFSYMSRSGNRVFITSDKRIGIVYGERYYTKIIDVEGPESIDRIESEEWNDGNATLYLPNISFEDFSQYTSGILIYDTYGKIVCFFNLFVDAITDITLTWKPFNTFLRAKLIGQEREKVEEELKLDRLEDPNLVPFIKNMIPSNYFRDSDIEESVYYKFIKNYIEYLSEPNESAYKSMLNVIRHLDPLDKSSVEYLWDEAYKRNIYLDKKKKEETIRFFLAHRNDFYSAKGTVESYKFLFKLLYNEEVDIDIDDFDSMMFYITVDFKNVDPIDIVGKTIYTKTGKCRVSNIDRVYIEGEIKWQLGVISMIGTFYKGQEIQTEDGRYKGIIDSELKGKELLYDDIDYINGSNEFYVMRIRSRLPVKTYREDVRRFVHPVGINFIGIVNLTIFMNAGLNLRHMQTIINKYCTYRFDSGYPTHYPDRKILFDSHGNIVHDEYYGEIVYVPHHRNGELYNIDVKTYNDENIVDIEEIKNECIKKYVESTTANDRRRRFSPLFDASGTTFSMFRDLTDSFILDSYKYRLKDNIGNPRDPINPTQRKLDND